MLRGHLATGDGLTVEQCRARWKLTREHEITAPGYSERRSDDGPSGDYGITVVNNAGSWHIAMHVSNTSPPKTVDAILGTAFDIRGMRFDIRKKGSASRIRSAAGHRSPRAVREDARVWVLSDLHTQACLA
jgi:hypothetical protein